MYRIESPENPQRTVLHASWWSFLVGLLLGGASRLRGRPLNVRGAGEARRRTPCGCAHTARLVAALTTQAGASPPASLPCEGCTRCASRGAPAPERKERVMKRFVVPWSGCCALARHAPRSSSKQ